MWISCVILNFLLTALCSIVRYCVISVSYFSKFTIILVNIGLCDTVLCKILCHFGLLTFKIQNENRFIACRVLNISCNIVYCFEKNGKTQNYMIQNYNADAYLSFIYEFRVGFGRVWGLKVNPPPSKFSSKATLPQGS